MRPKPERKACANDVMWRIACIFHGSGILLLHHSCCSALTPTLWNTRTISHPLHSAEDAKKKKTWNNRVCAQGKCEHSSIFATNAFMNELFRSIHHLFMKLRMMYACICTYILVFRLGLEAPILARGLSKLKYCGVR